MQVKTIQKVISSKMVDWLNTITDIQLQKDVHDNLLVSGGSITSLFLNEKVNDFDVYIKNRNVLLQLVQYYCKEYNDIEIFDGERKQFLIEQLEKDYSFATDDIGNILSIRSSSIRNLKDDQIKLYFADKGGGKRIEYKEGELIEGSFKPVFFSPNAISLSDQVQIVNRFHGSNEDIHKTFDFIHVTNYFTFKEGLVTNTRALESILTKQLKYQGSLYPVTSIIRMKKFIKRGWNISAGEIFKIIWQIAELNLKDFDVLEDQLIGIDVVYFSKLIEILRDIPKEKNIDSHYISTIIDRVFNEAEDVEE